MWSAISMTSGLCSTTSTVLPLSRRSLQQRVHALDVVRMQARGRLVEDVADVGERRAEVADHLGALRLAARERAGRRGRARGSRARCRRTSRSSRAGPAMSGATSGSSTVASHVREIGDLHGRGIRDVDALDLRRARALVQPRAAAVGAGGELDGAVDEGADVRLQRVAVLLQHRLRDLRDEPLVGHVDVLDLDLRGLLVEEVLALLLGVVLDRLVRDRRSPTR